MSDSGGFAGISLLELFKLEAESHCAALTSGLLALEKNPGDASTVEPLMRAAHSIKGAARIIGLDVIVSLAHTMEECFLAAKSGKEPLTPPRVDQLLRGVDILGDVRSLAEADLPAWTTAQSGRIEQLVAALKAPPPAAPAATGTPVPIPPPVAPAPGPELSAPVPAAPAPIPGTPKPAEQVPTAPAAAASPAGSETPKEAKHEPAKTTANVRVASDVLNRMLFLAGESSVEAARMRALIELSETVRARERGLETAIETLREHVRVAERARAGEDTARVDLSLQAVMDETGRLHGAIAEHALRFEETSRRVEDLSDNLYREVLRSRMRPFGEGISGFPRMVRDIARELGKSVELRVDGEHVEVDRDILQKLDAPLTHMIRNALDHGVETAAERASTAKPPTATIRLAARHQSGMLVIEVQDDGRGIDAESVRKKVVERKMVDETMAAKLTKAELMEFLFLPGFSTKQAVTQLSGRGVGLDVVMSMVQEVSGTVTLESEFGKGSRFVLKLPVTRSVLRAALVRIGGQLFGVPLARLHRVALITRAEVKPVQGRMQFELDGESVGIVPASELLGFEAPATERETLSVLVIGGKHDELCGLAVDEVLSEEDLVVRPLDPRLGTVAHIASAAIRADGVPLFVIDTDDLLRTVKQLLSDGSMLGVAARKSAGSRHGPKRILVVDDSITVREVERQLLQRRGYHVEVAVDGKEGYNTLRAGSFDLLVTDVDMPRMTGIELIRALRREPKFEHLPVIIVSYKDREEDRMMGLEAGASAYLTKSSFQDDSLLRMVEDLIGAPA
ncbi:MAG: hybrid sensor histidine kinase/response regulator [Phycisphaerales bacterium]|nr:hybrid sensor histidine kinase/response regulator [Planctomycetota bacterium]